ncbi:pyridine nucleotide-disulfide oxidoreductase/dicluster-binding protein [Clostridium formicaceticum]|nr:pyridine nucleotide-disulfide oxidoreductase/dicluster-binding protein [Clostridium formicaceticum]AOY78340.1 hypothetical protein BJL90_11365 [Clostridium formicaceticum]
MDLEKLLSHENWCIQDNAPSCVAQCPLHVDVKTFVMQAAKKDWKAAYKTMQKKMPFPKIIARICDHPCENKCVRNKIGGPIQISFLEKVIVQEGSAKVSVPAFLPKKDKKAVVIGGGISGLTTALDLRKKGYYVAILEKSHRLGGRLWDHPEKVLPKVIIEEELSIIPKMGIEVQLNTFVDQEKLEKLMKEYDALYLGTGTWPGGLEINPITFETQHPAVFAGGCLVEENKKSIIESFATGRRSAVSIDRYLSKVSLKASRDGEGAYETELIVNIEGVKSVPIVAMADPAGYSAEEGALEAQRCIQCACLECTKGCVFLEKFGSYPKKYIRQIYNNEALVMGKRAANTLINSCSLCGLCGEVCPTDLNMRELFRETRVRMMEKDRMPPSAHEFALRDFAFNTSEKFTLLKHQPGKTSSKYLYFPGCQLSASAPEYVEKTYQYLIEKFTDGVGLMLDCCGAPAEWAGREDLFKKTLEEIKEKWISMGKPTMIVACSTCNFMMKNYLPEIKILSLWEVMNKEGLPTSTSQQQDKNLSFAIHDACTTRDNAALHKSVRELIEKLGYKVEELKYSKEKTKCCGYGGLTYFANREIAEAVIEGRIAESSKDYIAYCSMCRDLFSSKGKRILHLLDLIYGDDLNLLVSKKGPTLSERHANRTYLKIKLLKELWGEEITMDEDFTMKICLTPEAKEKMEKRLILMKDIQQVIQEAESTDCKFIHAENGHFLASKRFINVTYWVEYEINAEDYIVHNAYSHRMEIMEEKE